MAKEKHNAKILSIYLSKFYEKSQNYSSIKVHVKWSLGELERFIARSLRYVELQPLEWFLIFATSILKTTEEWYEK